MEYNSCYAPHCPRREECTLWHNAQKEMEQGCVFVSLVNPKLIEEAGGYEHCPEFYQWQERQFARGMRWRYGSLTGDAQTAIHTDLTRHFGYALIGRMRRGDEVISPEDQEIIRVIFARHAAGVEPEFKSFEMHYIKPPRRK